jgi:hypothetical protein
MSPVMEECKIQHGRGTKIFPSSDCQGGGILRKVMLKVWDRTNLILILFSTSHVFCEFICIKMAKNVQAVEPMYGRTQATGPSLTARELVRSSFPKLGFINV